MRRPSLLPSLYVAAIALEGFDTASTLHILNRGGVEVNPFTRGLIEHPVAFVAVKASVTAASIAMTERLWKRDHRIAAVTLMVVSNTLMSFVAAQNTSVVLQLR